MSLPRPHAAGFTLVELLISLAILALLASLVVPLARTSSQRMKEQELRYALREMRTAIDVYKRASDEGRIKRQLGATGYPPTLTALVEGVTDQRDPTGRKMQFLRRIPRDPMFPDQTVSPNDMWVKRSYASDANSPGAGDDVYDVTSGSQQKALNGVPYNEW